MDRKQDDLNEKRAGVIVFSDDWDTYKVVMKEGVEVCGVIKTCQEKPGPHDDEHCIFILEHE